MQKGSYMWWKKAKAMCKLNKARTNIPDLHCPQGHLAVSDCEKAATFSDLFSSYSQSSQSNPCTNNPPMLSSDTKFSIQPLSKIEVLMTLQHLSTHSSTTGSITNKILRHTASILSHSLTALFNRCISSSELPTAWKSATVIPLYKGKGARNQPSSYRPISLLNSIGKVYECLVSKQFYSFVEDHNLLSPAQFGFRRHRSTTDQLLHITSNIYSAFDKRVHCDGIFLDFSKAFDRVDHQIILQSVAGWCSSSASDWVRTFISNRTMRVKVGQSMSQLQFLSAGVPQGSHLGPLLFNLSVNSLSDAPSNSKLTLFADDANLLSISKPSIPLPTYVSKLQSDVDECTNWANTHAAILNVSKCKHVPFSRPTVPAQVNTSSRVVTMAGSPLSRASEHRHLGVLLTPALNFDRHISSITNKYRSRVFLLCNMSAFLPSHVINLLYKCYVRPTLEYAIPIWFPSLSTLQCNKLTKLQATAARNYIFARDKARPDWLTPKKKLNALSRWESLQWRRQILALVYFHHVFYKFPAVLIENAFLVSHSTRHPTSILLPRSSAYISKSFLFLLSIAWNKLPEDVRSFTSPCKFNKAVRRYYNNFQFDPSGIPDFWL